MIRKPVLDVLRGDVPERIPCWLMRQAGRYLSEYRALRAKAGGFLDLCLTPELAAEITLQPLRRFHMDAAILFADILLVPFALGRDLSFREGEGPYLPPLAESDIAALAYDAAKTAPVMETLRRVKSELSPETTLIGFCGAPFTVACYMIDGNSKNAFSATVDWAREKPAALDALLARLVEASETYLCAQIEAGAEALQLFESWAGLLASDAEAFARFIIEPTRDLVARVKKRYPHIPIIGFPREAAENYAPYLEKTSIDCLSIDPHVSLAAAKELQRLKPLQGNLDPTLLVEGGEKMRAALTEILQKLGPRHILNLGHGVVPQTPPEHVADFVRFAHEWKF